MNVVSRNLLSVVLVAGAFLFAGSAQAEAKAIAQLTMNYQKSAGKQMEDGGHLLVGCKHLGSGYGSATGILSGRIGWDLYENMSRKDFHPAQFRGYLESDGKRHPFHIIGIFTPDAKNPDARWQLSGTIVFDDGQLLASRHALVSGYVETGVWHHHYTVWELGSDG